MEDRREEISEPNFLSNIQMSQRKFRVSQNLMRKRIQHTLEVAACVQHAPRARIVHAPRARIVHAPQMSATGCSQVSIVTVALLDLAVPASTRPRRGARPATTACRKR